MSDFSEASSEENKAFSNEAQNAIFNFLFVLVTQYSETMSSFEAVNKACDWMISLAETIKNQAHEFDLETQAKYNLFTQEQ